MRYYDYEGCYLELKDDWDKNKGDDYWKQDPVVYGRKFLNDNEDPPYKTVLQYWFFYIYNDWDDIHEGDWKMIQIILNSENYPELITYFNHHGGTKYEDWNLVDKGEGNHPKVYVTLGGHGSWNKEGENIWEQKIGICVESIDKTGDGDKLYPQTNYTLEDISKLTTSDWIYWKGYWGKQNKSLMYKNRDDDKYDEIQEKGPPSPPYIDYINKTNKGEKS